MTDSDLTRDSWWDVPKSEEHDYATGFAPMEHSAKRSRLPIAALAIGLLIALSIALYTTL